MRSNGEEGYRKAFGRDDESLAIFLRAMAKFDRQFCELMAAGVDFTLRMEIHGNCGEMIHCRVYSDGFERPSGVEARVERKGKARSRLDRAG